MTKIFDEEIISIVNTCSMAALNLRTSNYGPFFPQPLPAIKEAVRKERS